MKRLRLIVLASALLSAAACQKGQQTAGRPHVKVAGKITMNNKPVSGALVVFTPNDTSGEATSARTGADGTYTLMSPDGAPGAVPGTYKVTLSRLVGPDGKELPAGASPFSSEGKETIPPPYTDAEKTKLLTTVPAGQESVTLDFPLQGNMK